MPITGVIAAHNVEFIWEAVENGGIDLAALDYEDYLREEYGDDIPDDVWDYYEPQDGAYLIGDWIDAGNGLFEPHPDGEYSAVLQTLGGAYNAHVILSKHIAHVRHMCSPCCPRQADLDSGPGDIIAYTLPPDIIGDCNA